MKRKILVSVNPRIITTGEILVWVWLITFFLEFWAPATSGSTLSGDAFKNIIRLLYFVLVLVIMLATLLYRKAGLTGINCALAMTPIVYCLIHKIWVYDGASGSVSTMLVTVLFAFQTEDIKSEVYRKIRILLIIMSLIGIVCFASYYLHLGLPYEIQPYYSLLKNGVNYINYHVCYFYRNAVQIRLCGLFNEPGWFGTFLAFYLCSEDLNFKKWENVVALLAGILTFSLAFYVLLVLYYVLVNISNWKRWIWILLIPVVYVFVFPYLKTGNEVIDSFIGRFGSIESIIQGIQNSRTTNAFDNLYSMEMQGERLLFGFGSGYSLIAGGGNLSIKTDLLDFGYLGTIIFYLPIMLLLIYKVRKNRKAVCFLICIAASLYQRPWIFEASNFILTVGAVSFLSREYQKTDKRQSGLIDRKFYEYYVPSIE